MLSAALAAVVLALPIAFLAFIAAVSYAGCFFQCDEPVEPDYVAVGVSAGLAVLLLADIVLCGIAGYRRWERPWPWVALGPVIALGIAAVGFMALGVW